MSRGWHGLLRLGALVLVLAVASAASAQAVSAPRSDPETAARPSQYWADGKVRLFLAGLVDVGLSVRGKMMVGYGKPHWTWIGLEFEGLSTTEMGLGDVRARLALVLVDLAASYRKTYSYRRSYLEREAHYDDGDLKGGPKARYDSLDLWAWGLIPAGKGFFDWEFEALRVLSVPAGQEVYEEWLRTPVRLPWATVCRLAYAHTFVDGKLSIGVMGEWLWPGHRGFVYRAGPLGSFTFSPHWDVTGLMTVVVDSPDQLGFYNGIWGTLRARYRWASGERSSLSGQ
jgi:hypothetical protein